MKQFRRIADGGCRPVTCIVHASVPINGVTVFCANESDLCQRLVSVVGS
jgi:hypothetical protein